MPAKRFSGTGVAALLGADVEASAAAGDRPRRTRLRDVLRVDYFGVVWNQALVALVVAVAATGQELRGAPVARRGRRG